MKTPFNQLNTISGRIVDFTNRRFFQGKNGRSDLEVTPSKIVFFLYFRNTQSWNSDFKECTCGNEISFILVGVFLIPWEQNCIIIHFYENIICSLRTKRVPAQGGKSQFSLYTYLLTKAFIRFYKKTFRIDIKLLTYFDFCWCLQ